jgi:hypothetical protein
MRVQRVCCTRLMSQPILTSSSLGFKSCCNLEKSPRGESQTCITWLRCGPWFSKYIIINLRPNPLLLTEDGSLRPSNLRAHHCVDKITFELVSCLLVSVRSWYFTNKVLAEFLWDPQHRCVGTCCFQVTKWVFLTKQVSPHHCKGHWGR